MKTFKESALKVRQQDIKPMTKIMANQYVEKGNFKRIMDLLKHMGKKVTLDVPKEKTSKVVWTVEGRMNESMDQKMFDSLKKGDKVGVTFGSGIRSDNKVTLQVKSKSKSAKYNLEKINCFNVKNPGGMKYTIYNRQGKFSLAQGDMATHGAEFTKESVDLEEKTKWKMGDGRPRNGARIENDRFWNLPLASLKYIAKDAGDAMKANPNGKKAGKYADEVNDAATVMQWRKKNGIKENAMVNEAMDLEKMSKELLKHKSKGVEYEKAAAYIRAIHNNSNVNVQDKAFMGLTKMLKDMDDFTKRTTITKILKDNGFRVKGGALMRESVDKKTAEKDRKKAVRTMQDIRKGKYPGVKMANEEVALEENYRTLARAGMGAETKNSIKVGTGVDYYRADGAKYMGKITKMTPKGYIVKDDDSGGNYQFTFHDPKKAKEIIARLGKGKYNEEVETKTFESIRRGVEIAKKSGGAMTPAVKKIDRIKKNLSNNPRIQKQLRKANEEN